MYSQREIKPEEVGLLLKKYLHDPMIINHSYTVGFFALNIALISKLASGNCNPKNDFMGGCFHDIAKEIDPGGHPIVAREILYKEGLPELAEIAGRHGFAAEIAKTRGISGDFVPRTLDQKIVAYADFRVINTTVTSLYQRIKCLKRRYELTNDAEKLNHLRSAIERIREIEREFMELWSKAPYLSTYMDELRKLAELKEQKLIF